MRDCLIEVQGRLLSIDFGWNLEPIRLTRQEAYDFYHRVGEKFFGIDILDENIELEDQDQFAVMQIGDVTLQPDEVASFLDAFSLALEEVERLPIREELERTQHVLGRIDWIHEGF